MGLPARGNGAGAVTQSRPVNLSVAPGPSGFLWGLRILPTGAVLFFYSCPAALRTALYTSDNLPYGKATPIGPTLGDSGM